MTQTLGMPQVPVLIVGAGPVGATIANLLGTYGVPALVIDRSPEILDYPRAVGLDDEAMRAFQAAGVAQALLKDMIQNVPLRMYSARKQCFAEILPSTREFGWCRRNLFSQPLGERALRAGLARFPALYDAPRKIKRGTACLIKSGIARRHTAHAGCRITMAIGTGLHGRCRLAVPQRLPIQHPQHARVHTVITLHRLCFGAHIQKAGTPFVSRGD